MSAIKGLRQNYVMTIMKVPKMDCVSSLKKHCLRKKQKIDGEEGGEEKVCSSNYYMLQ